MGTVKENKWFIAFKRRGPDIFDLSDLTYIQPPRDKYYADPFLYKHKGKNYIFFEEYDYNKGRIAYMEIGGKPKVCLERDFHLSFPCIFELNGEIYMLPEAGLSGKLIIYRAKKFPDKWEESEVVAEGSFADPVYFDGRIYCSDSDNKLTIFHKLNGEWVVYTKEDTPHYRSAGNIFKYGGSILRPVQDCIERYGKSIKFVEDGRVLKEIKPDWFEGLTGTHTFNFNHDYIVIDGRVPYETKIHTNR